MKKIAITGPIGSGKTHICGLFKELGIPVFDSDSEAKELYASDPYIKNQMKILFGNEIYNFGVLDKARLANIIFNDEKALKKVMVLINGALLRKFYDWCYELEFLTETPPPFVLYESAILMNNNFYKMFDVIFVVDADEEIRKNRVFNRSGLTEDKFYERDSKQKKVNETVRILDREMINVRVIENDGSDLKPLLKMIVKIYEYQERNKD